MNIEKVGASRGHLVVEMIFAFLRERGENAPITSGFVRTHLASGLMTAHLALDGDDTPIGLILTREIPDIWKNEKVIRVELLYVHPGYRDRGIGRDLMQFLDAFTLDCGSTIQEWEIWEHETELVRQYEKIGAQREPVTIFRARLQS